ncbi:MAG: hypothetical protein AAF570_09230 [Bacteroidota bacterium]
MKRFSIPFLALLMVLFVAGCGQESGDSGKTDAGTGTANTDNTTVTDNNDGPKEASKTTSYNLADKGIPVTLNGPAGAEVKKGLMSGELAGHTIYDWDIVKDNFVVNVNMIDIDVDEGQTAESLYKDWMDQTKSEAGFEMVMEEGNGAVYKTNEGYDFYLVHVKDNREISFTTGLTFNDLTEDDVKAMYNASKAAN